MKNGNVKSNKVVDAPEGNCPEEHGRWSHDRKFICASK